MMLGRKCNSIALATLFLFVVLPIAIISLCSIAAFAQEYDSNLTQFKAESRMEIVSADTLLPGDIVRRLFSYKMDYYKNASDSTKAVLDYEIIDVVLYDDAASIYGARWIAFITYSVKPTETSFNWWRAGNGHCSDYDTWVRRKMEYYAVHQADSMYVLYIMGTGINLKSK